MWRKCYLCGKVTECNNYIWSDLSVVVLCPVCVEKNSIEIVGPATIPSEE